MSELTTQAGRFLAAGLVQTARWSVDAARNAVGDIEIEAREAAFWQDHRPGIAGDVDDSTWLDCSCGWDQQASKLDWFEHLESAVTTPVTVSAVFREPDAD